MRVKCVNGLFSCLLECIEDHLYRQKNWEVEKYGCVGCLCIAGFCGEKNNISTLETILIIC